MRVVRRRDALTSSKVCSDGSEEDTATASMVLASSSRYWLPAGTPHAVRSIMSSADASHGSYHASCLLLLLWPTLTFNDFFCGTPPLPAPSCRKSAESRPLSPPLPGVGEPGFTLVSLLVLRVRSMF